MSTIHKLIIINRPAGKVVMKKSKHIPAVGTVVDMFHSPMPMITQIINWSSVEIMKHFGVKDQQIPDVDALVLVE
jgi:hypothetical protein